MDRAIIVFLSLILGLGLGIVLVARRPQAGMNNKQDAEEEPWRGVPPWAVAAALIMATLLSLGALALAGPILAAAAAVLLFEVAALVLKAVAERHQNRIQDEALILADTLVAETTLGATLPDALAGYVRRHGKARLAGEIQRFILDPLRSGETPVAVLNCLANSPRYRNYPTYHRLLVHLARAVRGRSTPEEMEHTLRTFLDTTEMIHEAQQELSVDISQTRYTRWTVILIICGGLVFMTFVMPDARQHWLNDLVGQITMLIVSLSIAWAIGMGELLARTKGWRF